MTLHTLAVQATPWLHLLLCKLKTLHETDDIFWAIMYWGSPYKQSEIPKYNWLQSNLEDTISKHRKEWELAFKTTFTDEQWFNACTLAHKCSIGANIQETLYKILTNWYLTPAKLHASCFMLHIWWGSLLTFGLTFIHRSALSLRRNLHLHQNAVRKTYLITPYTNTKNPLSGIYWMRQNLTSPDIGKPHRCPRCRSGCTWLTPSTKWRGWQLLPQRTQKNSINYGGCGSCSNILIPTINCELADWLWPKVTHPDCLPLMVFVYLAIFWIRYTSEFYADRTYLPHYQTSTCYLWFTVFFFFVFSPYFFFLFILSFMYSYCFLSHFRNCRIYLTLACVHIV